jgi:hypothetical protein
LTVSKYNITLKEIGDINMKRMTGERYNDLVEAIINEDMSDNLRPMIIEFMEGYSTEFAFTNNLLNDLGALLENAQQTPMAPPGVKHVWADDLNGVIEEYTSY